MARHRHRARSPGRNLPGSPAAISKLSQYLSQVPGCLLSGKHSARPHRQSRGAHPRPIETLVCEEATIRFIVDQQVEIRRPGEHTEIIALQEFDALHANHMAYHRYLRGEASRPITTLADSRPFVALNSLAYVSSGEITSFTSAEVTTIPKDGHDYLSVAGLSTALEEFAIHGHWPGTARGWRESTPPLVHASDLSRIHDTITKISAASHVQEPA